MTMISEYLVSHRIPAFSLNHVKNYLQTGGSLRRMTHRQKCHSITLSFDHFVIKSLCQKYSNFVKNMIESKKLPMACIELG
jgi:hypothetical protein